MREERPTRLRRSLRQDLGLSEPDESPEIPNWAHPRVTAYDLETDERKSTRRLTERRVSQRATPARNGYILGMGLAPGITSIAALLASVIPGFSGTGDIPIGIVTILILQVAALASLTRFGAHPWAPSWVSMGFLVSIMLPMLALQVSLLHEPYVDLSMGSAGPALAATVLLLGLIGSYAVWVTWISQRRPEIAAILLMPSMLAIPALIGEQGSIDQHAALMILAEVTLITAVSAAVVWLFPGWPQLLAGGGAMAFEFVRLWVADRGPWRHESSGAIVSVVYVSMLVVAVLIVILVPMIASILNLPPARPRYPQRRRR